MTSTFLAAPVRRTISLTWRQIEVLSVFLRDGADNPDIAEYFHISVETVKSHFRVVSTKTGARNRTHIALLLVRREIVVLDPAGRPHEF